MRPLGYANPLSLQSAAWLRARTSHLLVIGSALIDQWTIQRPDAHNVSLPTTSITEIRASAGGLYAKLQDLVIAGSLLGVEAPLGLGLQHPDAWLERGEHGKGSESMWAAGRAFACRLLAGDTAGCSTHPASHGYA